MKECFESWERARVSKETQLRRELEETEVERRLREDAFRTELDPLLQAEKDLSEDLKASRRHESALQDDLDTARRSEEELRKRLEASRRRESVLQSDLEKAKRSETELRKEIDVLKASDARRRCNSMEKLPPSSKCTLYDKLHDMHNAYLGTRMIKDTFTVKKNEQKIKRLTVYRVKEEKTTFSE